MAEQNNSAYAEALLQLYNQKRKPIVKTPTEEQGPSVRQPVPMGRESYVNVYDQLYNKYKDDINFNADMYKDALARNEQMNLWTLIAANEGTSMSKEFYDPMYYDYDAMMMELYRGSADATDETLEERFGQVFNEETGQYETQSLGKMNEQQYIDYQLQEFHKYRALEIDYDTEKARKDAMSGAAKFFNSVGAFFVELGEGALSAVTGMVDFILAPFAAIGISANQDMSYADAYVEYYMRGATALEKQNVRAALDEWERTRTYFIDVNGEQTWAGKWFGGLANSVGMMIPSIALAYVTGGTSTVASGTTSKLAAAGAKIASVAKKWIGMTSFYTSIYSSNLYENAVNPELADSPSWLKIANAFVRASAEAVIEYALGRVLGGTVQNMLLGITGRKAAVDLAKGLSKKAALGFMAKSALHEGLEEGLQDFSTHLVNQFTSMIYEGYEKDGFTFQTLVDSFAMGALMSVALGGFNVASNFAMSKVTRGKYDKYFYYEGDDGKVQKVGGIRRLYLNSMLSDFYGAIESLKTDKITEANIEVAGEVYSTFEALGQMFSSWDTKRIANATKLFKRVIDHQNELAIEGDENAKALGFNNRKGVIARNASLTEFANEIETQVREMMTKARTLSPENKKRVEKAVKKVAKKLKDANVRQVKAAVEKDGTIHTDDPKLTEKLTRLSNKFAKLRKEYNWIFTVDGNIAIDEGDFLFVSEAWLENYETNEIYKYMAQDKILDGILADNGLKPLVKSIHEFDKKFSTRENLTEEQALMDFLFNESVFEAYLLSENGKNMFANKGLIFNIPAFIDILAQEKGVTEEKANYLKQIKERIYSTWKKPMMKAIVNWNLNMQELGADYVLKPRDRQFIVQYEEWKRQNQNAVKSAKVSSQYAETADFLLQTLKAKNMLSADDIQAVRDGLKAPAYSNERLQAVAILNYLSSYLHGKKYNVDEVPAAKTAFNDAVRKIQSLRNVPNSQEAVKTLIANIEKSIDVSASLRDNGFINGDDYMTLQIAYLYFAGLRQENYDASQILDDETFSTTIKQVNDIFTRTEQNITDSKTNLDSDMFVMEEHALREFGLEDIGYTQQKDNAIKAFTKLYGQSPTQILQSLELARGMFGENIPSWATSFWSKITKDFIKDCMSAGYDPSLAVDIDNFVRDKLESLLGDNFIVVPKYVVRNVDLVTLNNGLKDALQFIDDVLNDKFDAKTYNDVIAKIFYATPVTGLAGISSLFGKTYTRKNVTDVIDAETGEVLVENLNRKPNYSNLKLYLQANEAEIKQRINAAMNAIKNPTGYLQPTATDYTIAMKVPDTELLKSALVDDDVLKDFLDMHNGEIPLADVLKISPKNERVKRILQEWKIVTALGKIGEGETNAFDRRITLYVQNDGKTNGIRHALVHEINHALQAEYMLQSGASYEAVRKQFEALLYVAENYPIYRKVLNISDNYVAALRKVQNGDEVDKKIFIVLAGKEHNLMTHALYSLVQGEIWNEMHMHNGKMVRGFNYEQRHGQTYLITPDGKGQFPLGFSKPDTPVARSQRVEESMSDLSIDDTASTDIIASAIERDFENSLNSYAEGNTDARNTIHTGLSRISAKEVLLPLLSDSLTLVEKGTATLNDIIANPEYYLKPEIAEQMQGMGEGQAYRFLREYLEKQGKGISIDRDESTHNYTLVDDKAFNDMFTRPVANLDTEGTELYDQFNGKAEKLTAFYNENELDKMGVPDGVTVEFKSAGYTETIFDREHPAGHITIRVRPGMTNGEIMMRLNHEMRHLLQYYNGFEAGFTPDFVITDEMRADIKKHVPNIFKIAEKYFDNSGMNRKNWETFVIQRFFYFLTGGEQNAFGMRADMLQGKPVFVTTEAGKPTIFAPWYDAKSGDGRYKTDFIANRAIDENENGPKLKRKTAAKKNAEDEFVTIDGHKYKKHQLDAATEETSKVKELVPDVVTEETEAELRRKFEEKEDARQARFNEKLDERRTTMEKAHKQQLDDYDRQAGVIIDSLNKQDALDKKHKKELAMYDKQSEVVKQSLKDVPEATRRKTLARLQKGREQLKAKQAKAMAKYGDYVEPAMREQFLARIKANRDEVVAKQAEELKALDAEIEQEKKAYKRGTFVGSKTGKIDKYKSGTRTDVGTDGKSVYKYKYQYDNPRRYFSLKDAKGTNLEYFYVKGKRNQMDPDLQEFVKATTGKEEIVPKEVMWAIKKRKLTRQMLFEYIQKMPSKSMTQEFFDLLNDTIFHNNSIRTAKDANAIVNAIPKLWALARLLEKKGYPSDGFMLSNDFDNLMATYNNLAKDPTYGPALAEELQKFGIAYNMNEEGKFDNVDVVLDKEFKQYLKTLVLMRYDGSLASAYYIGKTARRAAVGEYRAKKGGEAFSLDESVSGKKGDDQERTRGEGIEDTKSTEAFDKIHGEEKSSGGLDVRTRSESVGKLDIDTRIHAYYQLTNPTNMDITDMRSELYTYKAEKVREKIERAIHKKFPELTGKKFDDLVWKHFESDMKAFGEKLGKLSDDAIIYNYNKMIDAQLTNGAVDEKLDSRPAREQIVNNIKGTATKLLNLVNNGKKVTIDGKPVTVHAVWSLLPEDVRDMFREEEVTVRGVKQKVRALKPEVYSVGRGAVKGERSVLYNQDLTHDTGEIYNNMMRLNEVLSDANKGVYASQEATKAASRAEKELARKTRQMQKDLDSRTKKNIKAEPPKKETEFTVTKRKRASDTPNNFTIVSATEMPPSLRKIFDRSFEEFADTKVQFASKDEAGNYYDRNTNEKEFKSRLQHEVTSWEAFYEANRESLAGLTRTEVMQIVDFIESGCATFNGPTGKLYAFQIFTLGYIVDAARRNLNSWNFSAAEVEAMEQLYERIASSFGSGLNAVGQMISTINPFKKVQQHMLEEYNINEWDLEPVIAALDQYQDDNNIDNLKRAIRQYVVLQQKMIINKTLQDYELSSEKRKERIDKKYDTEEWAQLKKRGVDDNALYRAVDKKIDKLTDEEFVKKVKRGVDFLTDEEFFKKVPQLNGQSLYQRFKSLRYLFMLSSPMTWMRNIYSNVIQTGFTKAAEVVSKIVFTPLGKKEYREKQWDLTNVKTSDEVKAWIDKNIIENPLFNALYDRTSKYDNRKKDVNRQKDLFVTLLTQSLEQKFAVEHRFNNRALNAVSNYVNHMLSDKRFVRFATGRYLGKILTQEVKAGNIDLRMGITNKVLDVFAEALLLANEDFMHKRSFVADMIDGLKDRNKVAYEVLTFWQPFLNSSFNWFIEFLNYTPIGIIRGVHKMVKLEDAITRANKARDDSRAVVGGRLQEYLARRNIGKGIIGTILLGLGLLLGFSGVLRIDEDDDKFYMSAGDIKVDISNLFGTSSLLIGAALTRIGADDNKDGEVDYKFEEILGFVADYLMEGFMLKDILDRHRWDSGMYDALLTETESVLRSFVPQFVQLVIRATNNKDIKYSSGFIGMIERWLNTFVITQPFGQRKINPYTGEVESKYAIPFIGELLKGGLVGPRIYWEYIPDYEEYARSLGVNKGQLTTDEIKGNKINNLKLNEKYGEFNGRLLPELEKARHLVKMPDGTFKTLSWDKMSDEQRANVIDRTMQNNAEAAKVWYWTQILGKKYYASPTIYKLLKQLGITKNVYRGDKGFVE